MAKLSTEREVERYCDFLKVQQLPIEASCKPWKAPRTNAANNYLWALYKNLVEVAGHTSEDWHTHHLGEYFGWRETELPSGRIDYRPIRTTTTNEAGEREVLKGQPFNDFLMFVESECAKRGVFVERGAL